jgi:hypothetical protein
LRKLVYLGKRVVGDWGLLGRGGVLVALGRSCPPLGVTPLQEPCRRLPIALGGFGDEEDVARLALGTGLLDLLQEQVVGAFALPTST